MDQQFQTEVSVRIRATPQEVWKAITTPALISQYLHGTTVVTDWKVGSPITYKGEWQGKPYEDKGKILQLVPEQIFQSTYWSSMGGKEDKPENYNKVTWMLSRLDGETLVTLTQDNIGSEKEQEQMKSNWSMVLEELRKTVENYATQLHH